MRTEKPEERSRAHRETSTSMRIAGLDIARFLALVGMMATHLWMVNSDGSSVLVSDVASGKAAALFSVLAGVGIALTTQKLLAERRFGAARLNVFGRGLALVLLGLTLGFAPGSIVVILVYYGVTFWLVVPVLHCTTRVLIILTAALALAWPLVSAWIRAGLEQPAELGSAYWGQLADPLSFIRGVFVTGTYPAMTWVVYILSGIVVGRLLLAAAAQDRLVRSCTRLVVVGAALAASGWSVSALLSGPAGGLDALRRSVPFMDPDLIDQLYTGTGVGAALTGSLWWLTSPAPHTGTTFDLAITAGLAFALIGTCILLWQVAPPALRWVMEPARSAGSAPLTVYTLHVLAVAVATIFVMAPEGEVLTERPWYISSALLWALHILMALLVGLGLRALHRRGPLEAFVSWSGRMFARLAAHPRPTRHHPAGSPRA